jgi:CRISPR-associated protein Cas2
MKQFLVVAYDIADDRRRQRIAKVLKHHGLRCNESVFECTLTDAKIESLKLKLAQLADEDEDIILYYYLCMPCVMKRESLGKRPELQPEIVLV